MLSWDLHVHPGSAADGRWGDGFDVREAARRAGVKGVVWKSHAGSTADAAAAMTPGVPRVLPSLVLNSAVTAAAASEAIEQGVRWIWGPSRGKGGVLGWELPLPQEWEEIVQLLRGIEEPLVLATSHLDAEGRHEFAALGRSLPSMLCTVTHSLYLDDDEVRRLASLGAAFEVDLYTLTHTVRNHPMAELAPRTDLVHTLGSTIYLTSDAGQAAVGDPYAFVRGELERLRESLGDRLHALASSGPERVARHICPDEEAGPSS